MNLGLLLAAAIGYLLGTIPTALLLVRKARGIDIREHGTGNVGAMNTYDVSGSKTLGITTMVLDALKGVAAVAICHFWFDGWYAAKAVAAVAVIVGHNYNIWLRGKGGRGLATATGAFAVINPLAILLWDLMYLTGYFAIRRHVHVGAFVGTIGLAILIWSTPDRLIEITTLQSPIDIFQVRLTIFLACIPIFLRHVQPLRDLVSED
ncbi:MAG: glycerol-3-phosphate acyltransferase [Candidatus Kapabacteria bacterium]|jgi:glycerol-3-phosphate acyltransferase PlsY|nr:glycerol-3-phosphate acyltransferase [Candidatus Kapabacteria bacterium]